MFIYLYTQMNHREKKKKDIIYLYINIYYKQQLFIYLNTIDEKQICLFIYLYVSIYIYMIANNIVIYIFIYYQKKIDIYKGK